MIKHHVEIRDQPIAAEYSAIIRTFDCLASATATIASLRRQTKPPTAIIVVDSGSTADDVATLQSLADCFVDVSDRPFNYARSINVGVDHVKTRYVLVISSHTTVRDATFMAKLLPLLDEERCAAAYVASWASHGRWAQFRIDCENFNCHNGLSNQFSLIPTALLRQRPFREEVFSCEDQEWASHCFREINKFIWRVETNLVISENRRANVKKWLNEQLALAYYVDRRRMGPVAIAKLLLGRTTEATPARLRASLALRLMAGWWKAPKRCSKYF